MTRSHGVGLGAVALAAVVALRGCSSADPAAETPTAPAVTDVDPTTPPIDQPDETSPDMPTGPDATEYVGRNRLGDETSPYLLQHEHNPVHWFPWGEEAFETARRLDRPILLSVGYSTCYWCHVMERESFESEEIAAVLNEHFVAIKLDREERPDVDEIYMAAVQIMNQGRGGWPMTVFLEPKTLKPFFAGTYFPPEDRGGQPGFRSVLEQVNTWWTGQREQVEQQAANVADRCVTQLTGMLQTEPLLQSDIERGIATLLGRYDRDDAGFGQAPKFPMPANLEFLLACGWDVGPVRNAFTHTLDRMATGGMYDQIGGGFHRYSTDAQWLVPHFEKMLYDNGQLASVYAEAHARTGDPYYERVLRTTLDYVLREMVDDAGGFHSAQDAEVNAREGLNYLWLPAEVEAALADAGMEDMSAFVLDVYGLDDGTNFRDPHHPADGWKNVIFLTGKPQEEAMRLEVEYDEFVSRLDSVNAALLAVRATREQPRLDDKVLSGWNGLMIAGMADAGRVLGDDRYTDAAVRAAEFVLDRMTTSDGRLLRTYRDGTAKIDAFLEDYAFFVRGLIALQRATGSAAWTSHATRLMATARDRFYDPVGGGYYNTVEGEEDLFVRTKTFYDGAVPSGNSVMLTNLVALYELSGNESYLDDAVLTTTSISGVVKRSPTAAVAALPAVSRLLELAPDRMGQPAAGRSAGPVEVRTSVPVVKVTDAAPGECVVTLDIKSPWHLNAHEPGIEYLIPLELKLVSVDGLELEVDYPAGKAFNGPEGTMLVHSGTVDIPIRVRKVGEVFGRAQIVVTFQVCDDKTCLAPQDQVLALRIEAE